MEQHLVGGTTRQPRKVGLMDVLDVADVLHNGVVALRIHGEDGTAEDMT